MKTKKAKIILENLLIGENNKQIQRKTGSVSLLIEYLVYKHKLAHCHIRERERERESKILVMM